MVQERKMVMNPFIFIIIIPIGAFILILLYDYIDGLYSQKKLNDTTYEILESALKYNSNKNVDDYRNYSKGLFYDKGYDKDNLTLVESGDGKYIIKTYATYDKVTKQIVNAILVPYYHFTNQNKETVSSMLISSEYIGYFNEYKEVVIEKYEEEIPDDDDEDKDTYNNIIIE